MICGEVHLIGNLYQIIVDKCYFLNLLKFRFSTVRTIKKMKAVILVILAATALASAPVEGDSQCLSSIMACVSPAKAVIADVQAIAGGDTSKVAALISDGEALISAVQAAASACGLTEPKMFSVQCF